MEDKNKSKINWTIISREKVYDGSPFINIFKDKIELPNGKIIDDYHRIEIDDAVMLIVENEREEIFKEKYKNLSEIQLKMEKLSISPSKVGKYGINIAKDGVKRTANQILGQKSVNMKQIRKIWPEIRYFSREIDEQLEINSHYKGYLKKQKADILAFKRDENLEIPENLNYDSFSGLSNEVKSKFKQIKPKTMGQALRIDGITPAAVYILLSHIKRKSIKHIA